jgi:hypothetical protein
MLRSNRRVQAASETGEEPADARGRSRIWPHDSRYAVARPPPETNRTITPIIGASFGTAPVSVTALP